MDDNLRKGAAVAMEWSIKKAILLTVSLCTMFCVSIFGGFEQTVEARAQVRVADREMKKSRDYQSSPLYERAHRIIYGMNPPQGPDGRVRIAIVINGDENIIVHDRVKDEIYQQLRKKFPREEFAVMKGSDVKTKLLQYAEDQFYGERGTATLVNRRTQSKTNSSGIGGVFGIVKSITDAAVGAAAGGTSASGSGSGDSRDYSGSGSVNNSSTDYNRNTTVEYKDDRLDVDGLPVGRQPRGMADLRREDYVRAGRECDYDYIFVATFSNGEYEEERHWWVLYNSTTRKKDVWLRLRFVDVDSGEYLYRNDIVAQGETGGSSGKSRMMQRAVREAMKEALADIDVKY